MGCAAGWASSCTKGGIEPGKVVGCDTSASEGKGEQKRTSATIALQFQRSAAALVGVPARARLLSVLRFFAL